MMAALGRRATSLRFSRGLLVYEIVREHDQNGDQYVGVRDGEILARASTSAHVAAALIRLHPSSKTRVGPLDRLAG